VMVVGNGAGSVTSGSSYTRSGGSWSYEAELGADGSYRPAVSVTGDGNTCIRGRRDIGTGGAGQVAFLTRSAGAWTTDSTLEGSSAENQDFLGDTCWIAKDGLYAVAVAPGDDQGGADRGLIYFFEYS
jgi:hypothetical protein